jgi:hypothetical protein
MAPEEIGCFLGNGIVRTTAIVKETSAGSCWPNNFPL